MIDRIVFRTLSIELVRANLHALIAVAADISGEYWAAENFLTERPGKWTLSFGVWQKRRLIGYAILSRRGANHVHLHHFMVAVRERSAGYGARMVTEMLRRCRAIGADILTLKTAPGNSGAICFYGRHGFAETGVERGYKVMSRAL
ncbi:MAG: GNAT family N-acetyltransferase [Chromatiales bacterium]|jgi:GNAT superfamily N-acetyltransferase|nr:GNAT family N-acetyltransferase [Chromatiales bacterium]